MAVMTETVTVVAVSTDPPNNSDLPQSVQSTTPAPAVGSITIQFDDGLRVMRAVPLDKVSSLAPLIGTQQPLALG